MELDLYFLNGRLGGLFVPKPPEETREAVRETFHLDFHASRAVENVTREFQLVGEAEDERPETHALDRARDGDLHQRTEGGRIVGFFGFLFIHGFPGNGKNRSALNPI
jgi:hypothetical protein